MEPNGVTGKKSRGSKRAPSQPLLSRRTDTADAEAARVPPELKAAISNCSSEEDLRVNMEMAIRTAHPDLPTPKYEKAIKTSLFSGRADAIHQKLVIEYEKPRSLRSQAKVGEALQQVYDYIIGLTLGGTFTRAVSESGGSLGRNEEEKLSAAVGLVTDGEKFIFVQRRRREWHTETRGLDSDTWERLQRWLRAMVRKDLSPENLIADFGPQSELAAEVVGVLARLVATGAHPKANVIYDEWKRIFGIVYGVDQLQRTRRAPESQALAAA